MEAAEDVVVDKETGEVAETMTAAAAVACHTPWDFHPHSWVAFPHQQQCQRDKCQRQQIL